MRFEFDLELIGRKLSTDEILNVQKAVLRNGKHRLQFQGTKSVIPWIVGYGDCRTKLRDRIRLNDGTTIEEVASRYPTPNARRVVSAGPFASPDVKEEVAKTNREHLQLIIERSILDDSLIRAFGKAFAAGRAIAWELSIDQYELILPQQWENVAFVQSRLGVKRSRDDLGRALVLLCGDIKDFTNAIRYQGDGPRSATMVGKERQALEWLMEKLAPDKKITFEDAVNLLRDNGFELSGRGYRRVLNYLDRQHRFDGPPPLSYREAKHRTN